MFLPSTCVLFFCAIFFALYLLVANSRKQSRGGVEFRRFQRLYITVYLVAQGCIASTAFIQVFSCEPETQSDVIEVSFF